MEHYELLYILPAKAAVDDMEPLYEKVRGIIKKYEGTIVSEQVYRKQKLAYPIKSIHQGYYILIDFDADPAKTGKIDDELRLTNEILRHIITVKIMQSAEEAAREKLIYEKLAQENEARRAAIDAENQEREAKSERRQRREEPKTEIKPEPEKPSEAPVEEEKTESIEEESDDKKPVKQEKVKLEDLDKKLDEILDDSKFIS